MHSTLQKIVVTLLLCFSAVAVFGQDTTSTINQLPTTGKGILYQDGKIYTVVMVLVTIFAGIIFYLTRLDKKITKIEQTIK